MTRPFGKDIQEIVAGAAGAVLLVLVAMLVAFVLVAVVR